MGNCVNGIVQSDLMLKLQVHSKYWQPQWKRKYSKQLFTSLYFILFHVISLHRINPKCDMGKPILWCIIIKLNHVVQRYSFYFPFYSHTTNRKQKKLTFKPVCKKSPSTFFLFIQKALLKWEHREMSQRTHICTRKQFLGGEKL